MGRFMASKHDTTKMQRQIAMVSTTPPGDTEQRLQAVARRGASEQRVPIVSTVTGAD
jgi:hypothetical protein